MITLTNFTDFWRKASVYSGLAAAVAVGALILIMVAVNIKNSLSPPKDPSATVAFGKLPNLDLTSGVKPESPISFSLETVSGDLPNLPSIAKVFAISGNNPSFGGIEYAKAQAKSLGFIGEPQIIPQGFKFVDELDSSKIFSIDSSNGNFLFQTSLQNVTRPTSTQNALSSARGFFNHFNLSPSEFTDDKVAVSNLKFSGDKLVSAQSILETSLMSVDFYRVDLDGLAILPILDGKSQVTAQVAKSGVVGAKMDIYNLERFRFATYPLKGIAAAYKELVGGGGVFNQNPAPGLFEITNVNLGYVESAKTSQFLQPVYIFQGRGSVKAFTPAVDGKWTVN